MNVWFLRSLRMQFQLLSVCNLSNGHSPPRAYVNSNRKAVRPLETEWTIWQAPFACQRNGTRGAPCLASKKVLIFSAYGVKKSLHLLGSTGTNGCCNVKIGARRRSSCGNSLLLWPGHFLLFQTNAFHNFRRAVAQSFLFGDFWRNFHYCPIFFDRHFHAFFAKSCLKAKHGTLLCLVPKHPYDSCLQEINIFLWTRCFEPESLDSLKARDANIELSIETSHLYKIGPYYL